MVCRISSGGSSYLYEAVTSSVALEKGTPVARRGRKAGGLLLEIVQLPKAKAVPGGSTSHPGDPGSTRSSLQEETP